MMVIDRPLVPTVARYFDSIRDEVLDRVQEILSSGYLIHGKWTRRVEEKIAEITGMKYSLLVTGAGPAMDIVYAYARRNGYSKSSIQALGFGASVQYSRLYWDNVEWIDIGEWWLPSISSGIENSVVTQINMFGFSYPKIQREIFEDSGVLVHDAAQAFGVGGWFGNVAVSFHATKIVGVGAAGALVTNDKDLYEFGLRYRDYGTVSRSHKTEGVNHDVNEITAAILDVLIDKVLYKEIDSRRKIVKWYEAELGSNMLNVVLDEAGVEYEWNYAYPVVLFEKPVADVVRGRLLEKHGIKSFGILAYCLPDEEAFMYLGAFNCIRSNAGRFEASYLVLPVNIDEDTARSVSQKVLLEYSRALALR